MLINLNLNQLLQPKIALLDEIDSGLDVDALRIVSNAINSMRDENFGLKPVLNYVGFYKILLKKFGRMKELNPLTINVLKSMTSV